MKYLSIISAAVLMFVLSGCEESKENTSKDVTDTQTLKVLPDVPNLKVVNWSPKTTSVGTVVNAQSNGVSALWFIMTGEIKPGTKLELWLGDNKLGDNVILNEKMSSTSLIPTLLLEKAGDFPLYLIHPQSKKRFDIGVFKILPKPLAITSPEIKTTTKKSSKPKDTKSQ